MEAVAIQKSLKQDLFEGVQRSFENYKIAFRHYLSTAGNGIRCWPREDEESADDSGTS